MEWCVVYARFNGLKYASLLEDTEENRCKLQELSELNRDCNLVLQLRRRGKVVFQTA